MKRMRSIERDKALAAVAMARQRRHKHVGIRPKPNDASSDTARSRGRFIDPDARRELALQASIDDSAQTWPGCNDWEVFGSDDLAGDGFFMQPRVYGSFSTYDDPADPGITDSPVGSFAGSF